MRNKLFAIVAVLAVLTVAGVGAAWAWSQTKAVDCCAAGLDCCDPPSACCFAAKKGDSLRRGPRLLLPAVGVLPERDAGESRLLCRGPGLL